MDKKRMDANYRLLDKMLLEGYKITNDDISDMLYILKNEFDFNDLSYLNEEAKKWLIIERFVKWNIEEQVKDTEFYYSSGFEIYAGDWMRVFVNIYWGKIDIEE